jgi:hypothetical protein
VLLRALDTAQVLVALGITAEVAALRPAFASAASSRSASSALPTSTSAIPRAWSKRTSSSGTTKLLSARPGPSAGSATVGSKRATAS